jgi:hypothetical protein
MTSAVRFAFVLSVAPVTLVACGGRVSPPSDETPDAGHVTPPPTVDSGPPIGRPDSDVATCVDIVLTPADYACNSDSDCEYGSGGTVCDGDCNCPTGAVNAQGQAAISTALSQITLGNCACGIGGQAACVGHVCTICSFDESGNPSCPGSDAGVDAEPDVVISPPFDPDGGAPDASDGGTCVDIDLSTYSTTCSVDSDCIVIQGGEICDDDCFCGNAAVSASGQARYDAAVQSIVPGDCGCTGVPAPQCVMGQCVECVGPNQPAGCLENGG